MQTMPTDRIDGAYGFFSSSTEDAGGNFMLAMQDAMAAVADGDSISASSALEEQPLVESPYTRHTTDGITYTLAEVCFTKQELQELRAQLLKEGAPEEALRQFDVLASQPDGATLAQVMASLIGRQPARLDEDDAHAITALLGQIDPTGELANDALNFMREGNGPAALELIQNALASMGAGESIDADMASVLALGRGLGLDAGSLRTLAASFGGASSLSLNAAQFDTLMNPAKSQFLEEAASMAKLDEALEKTLKPLIARARDRMEKEKAAAELQSRRVEQSRILIDRTVQENSREMLDDTVTGEAAARQLDGEALVPDALEQLKAAARNKNQANNSQQADNAPQGEARMAGREQGQTRQDESGLNGEQRDQGWDSLLDKITRRPAASANQGASSLVYSMLQGDPAMETPAETLAGQARPALARQLASQVEQGILTAMRDGSTRLDLQLHPAELGALTITLIARNGEVTAQIRSEKSETAELMTRQLDAIRINMEQQGIKVDKIEVQLDNRQQANDAFADLGQHNARQEENARRQEMIRLRNLASLRNNSENSADSAMAQSMHDSGQMEISASRAINLVA